MLEEIAVGSGTPRGASWVLDTHLDAFCARLIALGYRDGTVRHKRSEVSSLTRWMAGDEHLIIGEFDERLIEAFIVARRRSGRTCRGFRLTLLGLLEHLRSAGAVLGTRASRTTAPSLGTSKTSFVAIFAAATSRGASSTSDAFGASTTSLCT
jgi:hypothetical protein